jgi:hypothetical protein
MHEALGSREGKGEGGERRESNYANSTQQIKMFIISLYKICNKLKSIV